MGVLNIIVTGALLFILSTRACNAQCQECPAFWTRFRHNCYRYFGRPLIWREAENHCKNFSPASHSNFTRVAHLVSLENREENDFVSTFWESARSDGEDDLFLWLGLYKVTSEDEFKWIDNGQPKYTNWDYNRPNNYGGREDCAEMWQLHQTTNQHTPMTWNDVVCNSKRPFICKMPL